MRPLFPGKTEGSQLIEQIAVLGLPAKEDLLNMSTQMTQETINLVHKIDDIPKKDFVNILPQSLSVRKIHASSYSQYYFKA